MHESLLSHCENNSVQYLLVRGSSAEQIMSLFVDFNVSCALSNPIPYFITNISGVTKWCLSFVVVAYTFLVI